MKQKRVWILAMIIGTVVSSGVSGVVSAVTPDGVAQSDPVVEYLTEIFVNQRPLTFPASLRARQPPRRIDTSAPKSS